MAVLEVKTIADPVLYQKSETVTEFNQDLRNLVRDMFDTMYAESGVGLAAVQIGILKRVIVIDLLNSGFVKGVYINPEVVEVSNEVERSDEGCLSVPGVVAEMDRPVKVKIAYQDIFGKPHEISGEHLMARALLHEIDHTNGIVFVDELDDSEKKAVQQEVDMIKHGNLPGGNIKRPSYRQ